MMSGIAAWAGSWGRSRAIAALVVVLLGLSGCGTWGGPTATVVRAAVAQQGAAVEQSLWQSLGGAPATPTFKVDRVKPESTRRISFQGEPTYEVRGQYRFSLHYPSGRVDRSQGPFRVLLQRAGPNNWQWIPTMTGAPALGRDLPTVSAPQSD